MGVATCTLFEVRSTTCLPNDRFAATHERVRYIAGLVAKRQVWWPLFGTLGVLDL